MFALVLLPGVSRAAEARTVGLSYRAPADCPDSAAFIALVSTRTAGGWRFRAGTADPELVVEIRGDGAGGAMLGQLRRRTGDRVSEAREVRAGGCREVVRALALSAALSLDPARESGSRPWIWSVGAGAAALTLLPPAPMIEARVHLEAGQARREGLPGAALRLTLAHARNDLVSPGAARFALSSIGLSACPLVWGPIRLHAGGEVGLLAAEGLAVERPRSIRRWWTAASALASARWTLGRALLVEAYGGARVPLGRVEFVLEMPRRPVASVPALVWLGGVSLARTIP
jgi:hypothetical protein